VNPALSDSSLLQACTDIVFGDIDGEIVVLRIDTGHYLHLNSSGSFVFSLLGDAQPREVAWLYRRVREEYQVDEDTCRREVGEFLARCLALDLVRVARD